MACLPHLLKADNATIPNSGSSSAAAPVYDLLAYGTAKAALNPMRVSVANAMLWLCSPASGWASGQTIHVHAGGGAVRRFGKLDV